jgi:hypothetical protein
VRYLFKFIAADWWPTLRYSLTAWLMFAAGYFIKYGFSDVWSYLLFWSPFLLLIAAVVFIVRSVWFRVIYRPGDEFLRLYEQFRNPNPK